MNEIDESFGRAGRREGGREEGEGWKCPGVNAQARPLPRPPTGRSTNIETWPTRLGRRDKDSDRRMHLLLVESGSDRGNAAEQVVNSVDGSGMLLRGGTQSRVDRLDSTRLFSSLLGFLSPP